MNIEMIEPLEGTSRADLLAQVALLDEDARGTLQQLTEIIVGTLTQRHGTVVLMADVKGDGVAQIIACGNPALVPALLYTASAAADAMFKPTAGATVQ